MLTQILQIGQKSIDNFIIQFTVQYLNPLQIAEALCQTLNIFDIEGNILLLEVYHLQSSELQAEFLPGEDVPVVNVDIEQLQSAQFGG